MSDDPIGLGYGYCNQCHRAYRNGTSEAVWHLLHGEAGE